MRIEDCSNFKLLCSKDGLIISGVTLEQANAALDEHMLNSECPFSHLLTSKLFEKEIIDMNRNGGDKT